MAATTPDTPVADVSAAVRMAAYMVDTWIKEGRIEQLVLSPNTVGFVVQMVLANTNPILIEIPEDDRTAAMLAISEKFGDIGERYDEGA